LSYFHDCALDNAPPGLVAVSTWSRTRELEYVLDHSDASTLITVDRFLANDYFAMLADIGLARLPKLERIVGIGAQRAPGVTRFEDVWTMAAQVSDAEIDACQRAVNPRDIAYLLYT
jgi:fatty-acyl-CoA synthase